MKTFADIKEGDVIYRFTNKDYYSYEGCVGRSYETCSVKSVTESVVETYPYYDKETDKVVNVECKTNRYVLGNGEVFNARTNDDLKITWDNIYYFADKELYHKYLQDEIGEMEQEIAEIKEILKQ